MKKSLIMVLLFMTVMATAAVAATPGTDFLQRLDNEVQSGKLSGENALLYKFYYGFDAQKLPADYQPKNFAPIKSATPLIIEFQQNRHQFSDQTIETIESLIQPKGTSAESKATYLSPGGHFRFTYLTSGSDAVPSTDTNPANGIPDYVEKCASYMDYSWSVEIDQLGFTAPRITTGYYEVDFESMGYYGYTSPLSGSSTSITLHNTFMGFPNNDDPEGNVWGAAKVTCAHEFKHASQRTQSGWSEGGWVELDATWAEDIVYDVVNDYYNYLPTANPISIPATSLDDGGTGSYEDCIWQHFMTENWGDQIIPDLWTWRTSHASETMMASYSSVLSNYGSPLRESWALFTGWNYLCGSRNVAGIGYGEASHYPTGRLTASAYSYPFNRTGTVNKIAANTVRCLNIPAEAGLISVVFDGQDGSEITLTAAIRKTDGTGMIEVITLDANNDANTTLSVPSEEISALGFAVGNASYLGGAISYELTLNHEIDLPDPELTLNSTSVSEVLDINTTGSQMLELSNTGEAASVLEYSIAIFPTAPRFNPGQSDKSIAGSTLISSLSEYIPGESYTASFTVTNGSRDDEWLTDITLDFPVGFNVTASTNFLGAYMPMPTGGATGDGALVAWHGVDGSGWGVIKGSESATATVNFTVDAGTSGNQSIPWTITGDQYGGAPHDLSGSLTMTAAGPTILVGSPNGAEYWAIDSNFDITWTATILSEVKIELSRDGGTNWETITASTPNDGSESWTVTGPESNDCLLRISSLDDSVSDDSDAVFEIYQPVLWLTVNPMAGTLDEGLMQQLQLDFDATGLAIDTYEAFLVISHNAVGSPDVVPVTLTVTDSTSPAGMPAVVFGMDGNYPNPFNPMTLISFSIPQDGTAVIEVLDLRGHMLRTVFDGSLTAGQHEVRWDGQDDKGRDLASGMYLARLRSQGRTATHKMLLAR